MKSTCLRVMLLAGCAGCGYHPNPIGGDDDALLPIDAPPIDVNGDVTQMCTTWNAKLLTPCDLMTPDNGLQLAEAYVFDSDTGEMRDANNLLFYKSTQTLTQAGGPEAALINVLSFGISAPNGRLVLTGSKPVVIASWGEVIIDGTLEATSITSEIDAGNHVDGPVRTGAGANQSCGAGTGLAGQDAIASGGSGGGGGGALRGDGSDGAKGDGNGRNGGPGGTKISATTGFVRGGCAGGPSGVAGPSLSVGQGLANVASFGGSGGGGVGVVARMGITVNSGGIVNAGGGGGSGPQPATANGGGGGGSGGMIVLDSVSITVAGTLAANGGGGGSGACFSNQGDQGDNAAASATPAAGGNNNADAIGAIGSAGATLTPPDATNTDNCGGGGGGGGAGFISFYKHGGTVATAGSTVSPAAQTDPN